jgi:hypothetical protein
MKNFSILIFVICFFAITNFSQSNAPESDFQIWNETLLIVPLKKTEDKKNTRLSLIFYGILRGSKNVSAFLDERIGVGFEYRFNSHVTLTPSYIYRRGLSQTNRREYESRMRFDLGLEKKFKYVTIKDRNRIEHRFFNSRKDTTRYRNRFQLLFPVKMNRKEIFTPFIMTEPYYEFESKHWTRNELSVGISKKFNKNLTADFFYMLQNNRGNSLRYANIIGANLKFTID